MSSTRDEAAIIRDEYKRRGWTSRMVSVRMHSYSMGSSIRVELKDARVPYYEAQDIAERAESISRDDYGEILGGGNRYVHTNTGKEYEDAIGQPYVSALYDACQKLHEAPESASWLFPIGETGVLVGWDNGGRYAYRLWTDHAEMTVPLGEFAWGAFRVALLLQRKAWEARQQASKLRPTG